MARFLDKLSKQPQPLLYKMNLDKQPEEPLLQRVFSRLPKRRPGERYAISSDPLGFLAYQPGHPPLSGFSLRSQPMVSATTWVAQPPLSRLSGSDRSLLGSMDAHRMPGIVTSVVLLTLCLFFLLNLSGGNSTGETAVAEGEAEKTPEATAEEAMLAAMALSPEEEAEIARIAAEAEATAPAETPEDGTNEMAAETLEVVAAAPEVLPVTEAEPEAPAAMALVGNEPEPEPAVEPETATEPETVATPAPAAQAEPEPEVAAEPVESPAPVKAESETPAPASKPAPKPAAKPKAAKPAPPPPPEEPVYYTEQRSLAMLTEARYLYLTGEGKVAAEKLGLTVSAGHIEEQYAGLFMKMESEIRQLLSLFDAATTGDAAAVQAFLDAEDAIFPGQISYYEAQLPEPVVPATPETTEPTMEESPRPMGLQPPEEPAQEAPVE